MAAFPHTPARLGVVSTVVLTFANRGRNMSATKRPAKPVKVRKAKKEASGWYHGKRARTGNSLGFRFDKALFQSHPEFSGDVRGHVVAPGSLLVVAKNPAERQRRTEEDPMLAPFLSLLAQD